MRRALSRSDDALERAGIGAADRYRLRAAVELGLRFAQGAIDKGELLQNPGDAQAALEVRLRGRPYEVFACLFTNTRHRVVAYEEMFRGTVDGASVHPREVARRALELNASAVVAAHNHPSGVADPSRADRAITARLRDALALVDVRLVDHFVIGEGEVVSFVSRGWL